MLTAHSDVSFLMHATELKLTKYLVKPVTREELKGALALAIEEMSRFEIKTNMILTLKENYHWSYQNRELFHNNLQINLTAKESIVLDYFFNNMNRVLTYEELIYNIWDDYEGDKVSSIKTMVKNLRRKLPKDTIYNVYGVGYKIS